MRFVFREGEKVSYLGKEVSDPRQFTGLQENITDLTFDSELNASRLDYGSESSYVGVVYF